MLVWDLDLFSEDCYSGATNLRAWALRRFAATAQQTHKIITPATMKIEIKIIAKTPADKPSEEVVSVDEVEEEALQEVPKEQILKKY